jgi:hypothetical protein
MTTQEILQLEMNNIGNIHFILEGTFWHVYERSAFLTCSYLKTLKITRKYIKAVARDIVYGGFPKDGLSALIEKACNLPHGITVMARTEKYCSLSGFPVSPNFEQWRESWSLKEKIPVKFPDNLPVYKAIYDLLLALFIQVRNFPKDFQYTLGERIKNLLIELSEIAYHANACGERQERLDYLKNLCAKTETLRFLLRICYDLRLYNLECYIRLNEQLESISRQLHGWQKQLQTAGENSAAPEQRTLPEA